MLAQLNGWHFTKVSRIENARQGLSDADIRAWCTACQAQDQIADLIAESRALEYAYREWRKHARSGLRRLQESSVPLYERTNMFRVYEHTVLPGLFHTAGYANAIFGFWVELLDLPDDREAATAARLARQRILYSGHHRFAFILAEQSLKTRVGTVEVMVEQLDHLLAVMTLPPVSVGILPADAGFEGKAQTAFWMFDETLVRVETLTASVAISRPSEIETYLRAFRLMTKSAVYGNKAKALVLQARDELLQLPTTS